MVHNLYVEVEPVILKFLSRQIYVYYFCGGRGIGKTYGALDMCKRIGTGELQLFKNLDIRSGKFLYLRRTGVEAQSVAAPETCPFKKYNKSEKTEITADFSNKLGFGNFYLDNDKSQHIGYIAALSTFANLRGIDFSDVIFILYDECIPESKNKHPLKDEGYLFLNMLETINRNRIIEGLPEVVVCMLSNPIDLGSPLLAQLDLTSVLNSMIFRKQDKFTDQARSLHIEKYTDHKVSKKKSESMLYKFAKTTGFNERALSGDFMDNDLELIKSKVRLVEYTPYLSLENVCIYVHKSNGTYYCSQTMNKAKYVFKASEREKVRTIFYWLYKQLVIERRIFYDDYSTKVVFEAMIGYKPLLD